MSAPSIPNLLSLRGSRGGGRGRGRGRGGGGGGGGGGGPHSSSSAAGHDTVIQGTDTDAAVSRMSAVDMGYLEDPFAQFFVQRPAVGHATRRLPIINRGTYTRTMALDRLIASFLNEGKEEEGEGEGGKTGERQIISLGAGTDTRCFRLFSKQQQPAPPAELIYHEIDFPAVAKKKLQLVRSVPPLRNILPPEPAAVPSEDDEASWGSGSGSGSQQLPSGCQYYCHGRDLRDLLRPDAKPLHGLRTDVPTLLVSECCLCYLEAAQARAVVGYFAGRIPDLAAVLYEPIRPDDPFGRQMVANLAARRIRMPTLDAYKDAAAQHARLREAGFEQVRAMSVEDIWRSWIPEEEKERVDSLEGLDEVEEWNLLAAHYIVAWAWRGQGFEGWSGGAG